MKRYSTILLAPVLMMSVSCSKLLDIPETDMIQGQDALKTVSNCEQAVIGAYGALGVEMPILLNATFSDEVKKSEFYNAATTHEWQYSSVDVGIRDNFTAMRPNYRIIDRANRVLAAVPEADSLKPADNTALRNRVKGEALFLRAFAHLEVFRYYCDKYSAEGLAMPYKEIASLDGEARIKMAPYFDKLIRDVTEAKNLLPASFAGDGINRATKAAATALQARILLYKNDWAGAEAAATEYITQKPLSPIAEFGDLWKDKNTNEVVFQLVRTTAIRLGSLWRNTSASAANIGTVTWMPTDKLWNTFDPVNDVRFAAYLKDEPLLSTKGRPSKIVAKYAGTDYGTANENVNNAKVFRTGEMYLIRAEARAEQNRFTGANSAESDLNALRAARIRNYVNVTLASKQAAIDAIMLERFKELAFEGHRFWDLKRKGLPVERLAAEAPSTAAVTLPAGNYRFLLPIPNVEIQANKLMEQNPGYAN
ncbi:RagB/SusD family nutrient uptake outer membrane protein [Chitinophaga lutea]|nr:RagB/SusD family nutrient uptake outer membrane protein [Chitinophaga lutea]